MDNPLKPYPYQQRDIDKLVFNGGTGVVATQVGGGKTLVAIEVAKHIEARSVLVIAPKGTHRRAWQKTILRQIPNAQIKYLNSTNKGNDNLLELERDEDGWYLITPEFFRTMTWVGIKPDLAIFDEIHRASNRDSKTAKMLLTLKAKQRIGMSGTIAGNRIEGFWSVLRWIYPDVAGRSFWRWVNTYCLTKPDYFAGQVVIGEKKSGEIAKSIPCYIRHLKREKCCEFHPDGMDADLPSLVSIERTVQLSPEQARIYRKMEKDLLVWLGEHPLTAEIPVATRIRLRQITLGTPSISNDDVVYFADDCKSTKIDELFNIIGDHPDGDAMLVLTHSQKFAKVVTNRLNKAGFVAFEWSGAVSQKQRDDALERFIAGEIQFIVGVIAAIGEGTDGLQERCSTMVWLSKDDNRLLNEQAMGRLDRQGQKNAVISYEVIAEDTYDEGQLSKLLIDQIQMNQSLRLDADDDTFAYQAQETYERLGINHFLEAYDYDDDRD